MSNGKPQNMGESYEWTRYFDAVKGLPPRETLLRAIELFELEVRASQQLPTTDRRLLAIDVGCGEGRDTFELLRRGWNVIAIDSAEEAIVRVLEGAPVEHLQRLEVRQQRFEDARLPVNIADLTNCSFSIPHCDPEEFPGAWARLTGAIKPRGRFAGQLFGVNDEWARKPDGITRTYHTREQVIELLRAANLEAEMLDEVERDGKNAYGEPKHWHVFHIVARKTG